MSALPPVVDQQSWRAALEDLRKREKAATRELDAIAAQRRRLPMVEMPKYVLIGDDGPVCLAEVFDGRSQLIVYNHMWSDDAEWQCPGCTGFTSQFTRLEFLDNYDARFVIVTNGPIDEALAYTLAARGVVTRDDLADLATDDLTDIEDMDAERAAKLIMAARQHWFE